MVNMARLQVLKQQREASEIIENEIDEIIKEVEPKKEINKNEITEEISQILNEIGISQQQADEILK